MIEALGLVKRHGALTVLRGIDLCVRRGLTAGGWRRHDRPSHGSDTGP